ncbi:MAG: hypothetical protein HYX94_10085 [Chloroflexi bacterium]|nr:hypothetical protein [Chloroflexota bacterium]
MPTPLADMIADIRNDLHDNDATAYRWTDAVLQRHIERALKEYSLASPIQSKNTLTTTSGSRAVSLSTLTTLIEVVKVEYPVDYYPPVYPRFSVWSTTLTLLVDEEPSATNNVYVFWYKEHSIATGSTTIPVQHEDLVAGGAAAYAALEWANYAPNRVNVGGQDVWKDYLTWGEAAMKRFQAELNKLDYRRKLRTKHLRPL